MQIREVARISSKGVDITYRSLGFGPDGMANHYFLLMVFGLESKKAYHLAYS